MWFYVIPEAKGFKRYDYEATESRKGGGFFRHLENVSPHLAWIKGFSLDAGLPTQG